jgi:hypothetical protein
MGGQAQDQRRWRCVADIDDEQAARFRARQGTQHDEGGPGQPQGTAQTDQHGDHAHQQRHESQGRGIEPKPHADRDARHDSEHGKGKHHHRSRVRQAETPPRQCQRQGRQAQAGADDHPARWMLRRYQHEAVEQRSSTCQHRNHEDKPA